jgi:hypothetical protein
MLRQYIVFWLAVGAGFELTRALWKRVLPR